MGERGESRGVAGERRDSETRRHACRKRISERARQRYKAEEKGNSQSERRVKLREQRPAVNVRVKRIEVLKQEPYPLLDLEAWQAHQSSEGQLSNDGE